MVTIWPVSFLPFSLLPLPLLPCFSRENSFPGFLWGSRVCSAHCWRSDWWFAVLPSLTSSTSETTLKSQSSLTAFEGEMRQSPWHKGFWPRVKNSFWKKKMWTLYRPHCFPFILQSGPSIHYSILTFRHYNLFYFLEPSHSGSDVFPL